MSSAPSALTLRKCPFCQVTVGRETRPGNIMNIVEIECRNANCYVQPRVEISDASVAQALIRATKIWNGHD